MHSKQFAVIPTLVDQLEEKVTEYLTVNRGVPLEELNFKPSQKPYNYKQPLARRTYNLPQAERADRPSVSRTPAKRMRKPQRSLTRSRSPEAAEPEEAEPEEAIQDVVAKMREWGQLRGLAQRPPAPARRHNRPPSQRL